MTRLYARETTRRDLLPRYAAVITASSHMREEILRYGVEEQRVHAAGLMIAQDDCSETDTLRSSSAIYSRGPSSLATLWRLVFVARLTTLKGGQVLLRALTDVAAQYRGRTVLTVVGDGPERRRLERLAARIQAGSPTVEIRFTGWLGRAARQTEFERADLLVVPSIWPEPFGLVGPEAGLYGVPAAAFAVGGIPEWLTEGITGHLAPGHPPTPRGLADAIVRCLSDPGHHDALRHGALRFARTMSAERHLPGIISILSRAAGRASVAAS